MEIISSPEAMDTFAARFLDALLQEGLTKTVTPRATVLALSGELGAGKTTFTQALARALGIAESVVSPTFVVMKRYPVAHTIFDTLVHIDAYRLDSEAESEILKLSEVIENPRNLIVIEWAERLPSSIPEVAIRMEFKHLDEQRRTVTYTPTF